MLNWVLSILTAAILFGNSTIHKPIRECRVINSITVEWKADTKPMRLELTDQSKMSKLLHYLRHLDPQAQDAAVLPGDAIYRITLHRSDGRVITLRQRGITLVQWEDGPWESIPPEEGIRLLLVLAVLSDDIVYN